MSIAGGIHKAFERGWRAGCRTIQVFLKNSNQWRAKPLTEQDRCLFQEAQEASGHFEEWLSAGIRHWRLEFVHESADEVARVFEAFHSALDGKINGAELGAQLRKIAPQGTTEGSLYVPASYLTLPVLQ